MPRKNKRKFFGKSNKNKSPKLNQVEDAESPERQQNQQNQQHEKNSDANYEEAASAVEEEDADERKSEATAGTSLVVNDSAPAMGQLESVSKLNDVSETPREELQHKATITLKVIQFIGELPKQTRDNDLAVAEETLRHVEVQEPFVASAEINEIENDDNGRDNKSIIDDDIVEVITERNSQHGETAIVGSVPELDHNKGDEVLDGANRHQREHRSFDDNYRVESPKQVLIETNLTHHRPKRHAMLIQEISESSSSEEVKRFLDDEATALEMKVEEIIIAPSPKNYRVDSPESSDDNNSSQVLAPPQDDVMVQEISESSSSESVKNEILASISKQLPSQIGNDSKAILRVINIKELPSEDVGPSIGKKSSTAIASSSKITIPQFECKTERKLNKAEEAILESLYGNKSLLQIPNLPLDVISEEGSDCGSDIDKQASNKAINDELDDDVFFPLSSVELSKKPPSSRRRYDMTKRAVAEQPLLINTKIIETELNIPEGCKSWETTQGDSELQAELVYLTSASSSATDLSERGGDITEEEDADTSEDTETNSLLENISVPSLDNINNNNERDTPIEIRFSQSSPVYSSDYYQEMNEQKLPDILEEDEDQAPRSLDILESQQQIEDVNKELHHLVDEHEDSRRRQSVERVLDEKKDVKKEVAVDDVKIEEEQKAFEDAPEILSDIIGDKKIIPDNEKVKDDALFNRVTPTLSNRKNSSDSSTSSANSQCTIISQLVADHHRVDPLKDMCIQSLTENGFTLGSLSNNKDVNVTFHKKNNSASRNAPQIPVINELELHYECDNDDDLEGRENQQERVITILQVPPEINYATASSMHSVSKSKDKKRWLGLQSSQIPNLLVALSPLQTFHVMSSQDSNTSADVLLDMHKKFVERRAYHEPYESEEIVNSDGSRKQMNEMSQLDTVNQLEDGYFGDRESSVENIISTTTRAKKVSALNKSSEKSATNCDNQKDENENVSTIASCHENKLTVESAKGDSKMNSIRNCLLRDEFFKTTFTEANRDVEADSAPSSNLTETFEVKKFQLEDEMQRLDNERVELEEELKNLQSLQHFKREEFLFNEKKLQDELKRECLPFEIRRNSSSSSSTKYANDDFNEFIYSNEKLQQELYNEWQDKVLERNERKLQKTIKITSITETIHHNDESNSDRATSEKIKVVPLENEFMTKLRERRKRLSLTTEVEANSSTESLHHQNEESKKISPKVVEDVPPHLHEILKYYEEEIAQSKNSDESGESKIANPLLIGCLIGVSICLCGFYIGKHLITQK